jgi:hypothetical protein
MLFVGGFNLHQLLVNVYLIMVNHFSTILSFLTSLECNLSQSDSFLWWCTAEFLALWAIGILDVNVW